MRASRYFVKKCASIFLGASLLCGAQAMAMDPAGKEGEGGELIGLDISTEGQLLLRLFEALPENAQVLSADERQRVTEVIEEVTFILYYGTLQDKNLKIVVDAVTVDEKGHKVVYLSENRDQLRAAFIAHQFQPNQAYVALCIHELFRAAGVNDQPRRSARIAAQLFDDSFFGSSSKLLLVTKPNRAIQSCTHVKGHFPFHEIEISYPTRNFKLVAEVVGIEAQWNPDFKEVFDTDEKVAAKSVPMQRLGTNHWRGKFSYHDFATLSFEVHPASAEQLQRVLGPLVDPRQKAALLHAAWTGDFDPGYQAVFVCNDFPFRGPSVDGADVP